LQQRRVSACNAWSLRNFGATSPKNGRANHIFRYSVCMRAVEGTTAAAYKSTSYALLVLRVRLVRLITMTATEIIEIK
jgi:hypothetical protein